MFFCWGFDIRNFHLFAHPELYITVFTKRVLILKCISYELQTFEFIQGNLMWDPFYCRAICPTYSNLRKLIRILHSGNWKQNFSLADTFFGKQTSFERKYERSNSSLEVSLESAWKSQGFSRLSFFFSIFRLDFWALHKTKVRDWFMAAVNWAKKMERMSMK